MLVGRCLGKRGSKRNLDNDIKQEVPRDKEMLVGIERALFSENDSVSDDPGSDLHSIIGVKAGIFNLKMLI